MIFLDANAFYSYYGRKRLKMTSTQVDGTKLRIFLDNTIEKSIAATAFVECMVHFRFDIDILKSLIQFQEKRNIKVFNNSRFVSIHINELYLLSTMGDVDLYAYTQLLLKRKINSEVNFITLFYEIMVFKYAPNCA